jgi:CBS-domain-containing membrane protein
MLDAAKVLMQTHARRLPLLDKDTETGHEVIVSVLTQYRLLKFIALNVWRSFFFHFNQYLRGIQCPSEIQQLHLPLRKLKIGTYISSSGISPFHPIATATLNTPVFDVVHMFSERSISAVPIIDEDGIVVDMYETVDVMVRRRLNVPTIIAHLNATRHLYAWGFTRTWISPSRRPSRPDHPTFLVSSSARRPTPCGR